MARSETPVPRARLLVQVTESGRPRSFDWSLPTAPGAEMTVGRSRSADLTLRDEHVSGRHLRIAVTPNGHALIDLDTTNGTTLNGQAFTPHAPQPLEPGDRIVLGGSAEMVYQIDPTTIPPPSVVTSAAATDRSVAPPPSPAGKPGEASTADAEPEFSDAEPTPAGPTGTSIATVALTIVVSLGILGVLGYFAWVLLAPPPG
ncbi:MAG: FHA domain-containing protein [Planctomycetota bacterium]